MWADNAPDLLTRSPLRLGRGPDHTQRTLCGGPNDRGSSFHDSAPLPAADSDGQPAPALRRPARCRRDLLIEDMKDVLGRAVIYALAMLGLLHALGLVALA